MRIAITREVSPSIAACELTHLPRRPIDLSLARLQHQRYEDALRALDCDVRTLPADPAQPDSVFVEDAAVVFDEVAVIARPGAPTRLAEIVAVAAALRPYRTQHRIEAPATLDGGDVLRIGRRVYVGVSGRTNRAALGQLEVVLRPHGYAIHPVAVQGCLHLKSAATQVAPDTVLVNPRWVDPGAFAGLHVLDVAPDEPHAANGLLIGEHLVYPASFPATARRLEGRGIPLERVDVAELQKAEGAVTCCSLVFAAEPPPSPTGSLQTLSARG
jgi:dimethylargininase